MAVAAPSTAPSLKTRRAGGAPGAGTYVFQREYEGDNLSHPARTRRVQLFDGLGPQDVSRIATHAHSLRKARGEFVYLPGERAECVYVLRQGRVKLSVLSECGKEIAIDIIQPGEIFGE